ncbi:MAG: DUF808 family protein [Alphaproteobacteria bacterium]|nr:MAG: DUF808 family protein [Alphaproteobacteria bacterium]
MAWSEAIFCIAFYDSFAVPSGTPFLCKAILMTVESIAALTKLASIRAAGLVLDEIAVNTSMLQELPPKRKIPAVLKVMGGSLAIKMAVIPASLLVTAFAPGFIPILLCFGGFHLAMEGAKSLFNKDHDNDGKDDSSGKPVKQQTAKEFEKNTIKKVLIIDGLLSVEIAVMTLPIIAGAAPLVAAAALAATGAIRVAWMYGLIGSVINMPRAGEWLAKRTGDGPLPKAARAVGNALNKANPYIIKGFRFAGMAALLIIGGGLVLHGFPAGAHLVTGALGAVTSNGLALGLMERAVDAVIGIAAGVAAKPVLERLYSGIGKAVSATVINPVKRLFGKKKKDTGGKPGNDNTPAPAVVTPSQAPALSSAPDLKAAVNQAAPRPEAPANDAQPETPAPQPKINPPAP